VVFLDEIPTARTVLGGILILSASLGVGYMELKK
jgi:drug/metabolite transporter (DMT)-like permease